MAALKVAQSFGTDQYEKNAKEFITKQGSLADVYQKKKDRRKVPINLPDGKRLELSPGKHNKLQSLIVSDFASIFISEPVVLYIGDTAQKDLHIDYKYFEDLGVNISGHDKLPDVVILDNKNSYIFLIEAVTSHGPMNPKRVVELQEIFKNYTHGLVFVSAFLDFKEFKKHSKNIAWETEVWIAAVPYHMIHYNGDKFILPK